MNILSAMIAVDLVLDNVNTLLCMMQAFFTDNLNNNVIIFTCHSVGLIRKKLDDAHCEAEVSLNPALFEILPGDCSAFRGVSDA